MRIVADKNLCVGAGQCVLADPEVFDQNEEDGIVIVLNEHPTDLEKAREAVHICPAGALALVED